MDNTNKQDPIPEFETLNDIAEFWDAHSTADYEDSSYEVHFDVRLGHTAEAPQMITLLPELSETLQALAHKRGVSVETLINVWLTEKILELT
jgi:hypothetical protein